MLPFEPLRPFQHIAGSNCGKWSDLDSAWAILEFMGAVSSSHDLQLDMAPHWRSLVEDINSYEGIDLSCHADLINDKLIDYLPPYCHAVWDDNELTLQPSVESAVGCEETYSEIPYDDLNDRDLNPDNLEFILVVNDHGNASLYRWAASQTGPDHWVEVWAVV